LTLAEDVAGDDVLLPRAMVADVLSRLVDQSLVVAEMAAGAARYRMPETIRSYAVEQLRSDSHAEVFERRHAVAMTALAEASFPAVLGPEQRLWLTQLRTEAANWRKSLAWTVEERHDVPLGAWMIWGLTFFWHMASDFELEARRWIALAKQADLETQPVLAQARLWAAGLLFDRLPPSEQMRHSQQAMRLFEQTDDGWGTVFARIWHGWQLLQAEGTRAEGVRHLVVAVDAARASGDGYLEQTALGHLAILDVFHGDLDQARQRHERRLAITREINDLGAQAQILSTLCNIALSQNRYDDALAYAQQARRCGAALVARADEIFGHAMEAEVLRLARRLHDAHQCANAALAFAHEHLPGLESCIARLILIKVLIDEGEVARAWRETQVLIATVRASIPSGWGARYMCDVIACIASQAGDARLAARMFGTANVHSGHLLDTRWPHNDAEVAPHIDRARLALGDDLYAMQLAEGRTMSYEQSIEYALGRGIVGVT
jgi:tetratricopeptide (TPR) repeat protein